MYVRETVAVDDPALGIVTRCRNATVRHTEAGVFGLRAVTGADGPACTPRRWRAAGEIAAELDQRAGDAVRGKSLQGAIASPTLADRAEVEMHSGCMDLDLAIGM